MRALSATYHDAAVRRDAALMVVLDITKSEWDQFVIRVVDSGEELPDGFEPWVVNIVEALRNADHPVSGQIYLQMLASMTTEALEWLGAEVGGKEPGEGRNE